VRGRRHPEREDDEPAKCDRRENSDQTEDETLDGGPATTAFAGATEAHAANDGGMTPMMNVIAATANTPTTMNPLSRRGHVVIIPVNVMRMSPTAT
jgi:hypothetical protein